MFLNSCHRSSLRVRVRSRRLSGYITVLAALLLTLAWPCSRAGAACTPTGITPYIYVNGAWVLESSASVTSTTQTVDLGPQPVSGGSWAWTGPNGFTSTARQINSIALSAGVNTYTATYTNSSGCNSTQAFTITAPAPTAITPYLQVNSGAWQQTNTATVASGSTVNLGPQPGGGSWSWTGPNGFTSTAQQINSIALSTGVNTYTATFTNSSGAKSTATFTITVTGSATAITPYLQVNGGTWQQTNVATVASGSTVNLGPGPQASGQTWSWTGPNNFTSTAREIDSIALPSATNTYSVTLTNSSGATSTQTFTITVTASGTAVAVNINTLTNRHPISPFVYGNNDQTLSDISDIGYGYSRWGGNDASNYNYLLQTRNSVADWYYETYGGAGNQVQLITQAQNAGSHALTTMAMMNWVAGQAENSSNHNWSYSVAAFGPQCSVDPNNTDAGNGLVAGSTGNCNTSTTPVTTNAVTSAYYPLVDTASQCPSGTTDGSTCIDRQSWAQALASAFGSGTCTVPYSPITSCHFYDMDNEPDIWSGTHRDVHPAPAGYDELANVYEKEAANLKIWDPAAVRFGPVFCCWWFYWNGSNGADKGNHGGVDFLPWWLNQIKWMDQINGSRTLDVFDIHAYGDAGPTSGFSNAQLQAATVKVSAYYWDPATVNADTNNTYTTSEEPNAGIPFLIPRFKAMVNAIYPGTPLSFTEWGAGFAANGGSDFSTAIADADTLGVFGREGLSFASRWGGPSSATPEYLAWKMFTNYDGAHHSFNPLSVSNTNNGSAALFSSFASLNSSGTAMTIMVLNKDPNNNANVTFNLSGFTASTYVAYTLSTAASSAISASSTQSWNSTQSFAPYSITLLVINGSESSTPASEWYLNPDDLMIPASGTATLHPAIVSGSSSVTLSSASFDAYEGASACGGSLTLTNSTITPTQPATITVNAASTPGYCHYTVTGSDSSASQTKGGWIVVGNPPATLTVTGGNNQSATHGTTLSQSLAVTLSPGSSGGSANGAGILYTTSAGTLSNGSTSGTSVIAQTNSSGTASVTMTLPSSTGKVTVTAQDQFVLGGVSVTFTETAQ